MEQVQLAIEAANVIILVVNVQEGIVPLDREAAARLRTSGKPVLLAANKVDTSRSEPNVAEFSALGFDQVFPVSAIHGEGIVELMTSAMALLPKSEALATQSDDSSETNETPVEGDESPTLRKIPPARSSSPSLAGPTSANLQ